MPTCDPAIAGRDESEDSLRRRCRVRARADPRYTSTSLDTGSYRYGWRPDQRRFAIARAIDSDRNQEASALPCMPSQPGPERWPWLPPLASAAQDPTFHSLSMLELTKSWCAQTRETAPIRRL